MGLALRRPLRGRLGLRPTTEQDLVADDETLYRAVRNDSRCFPVDEAGRMRISSTAFNDRLRRPSVDRACLCINGPEDTRMRFESESAVLSLEVGDVRGLTATHGAAGTVYGVDVEPVPVEQNPAHAEIYGRPPFDMDRVFERIKQALARISTFAIAPTCMSEMEE